MFYDGYCNICDASVRYIINHSNIDNLFLISLQDQRAVNFLSDFNIDATQLHSVVFYDNGRTYQKSEAIFRICKYLSGIGPKFLRLFRVVPVFITDYIYNIVAKNRYRIAGRREECRLPTQKEIEYFL